MWPQRKKLRTPMVCCMAFPCKTSHGNVTHVLLLVPSHMFLFCLYSSVWTMGVDLRPGSGFYPTGPALDSHKSRQMARTTPKWRFASAALKEGPSGSHRKDTARTLAAGSGQHKLYTAHCTTCNPRTPGSAPRTSFGYPLLNRMGAQTRHVPQARMLYWVSEVQQGQFCAVPRHLSWSVTYEGLYEAMLSSRALRTGSSRHRGCGHPIVSTRTQ